MSTLPAELMLKIVEEATPPNLHLVLGRNKPGDHCADTRLSMVNIDEWRSVRDLMSLTPQMAALTGKQSCIPFPSTLLVTMCNCTSPVASDRVVPDWVLNRFDRMDIDVPFVMRAQLPSFPLSAILKMSFERHGGGWKLLDSKWHSIEGSFFFLDDVLSIVKKHFDAYMDGLKEGEGGVSDWLHKFRAGSDMHTFDNLHHSDMLDTYLPFQWMIADTYNSVKTHKKIRVSRRQRLQLEKEQKCVCGNIED